MNKRVAKSGEDSNIQNKNQKGEKKKVQEVVKEVFAETTLHPSAEAQ